MKIGVIFRIATWASAGFLVSAGWGFYFAGIFGSPVEPIVSTLSRLTQPGPAVVSCFFDGPHGVTRFVLENAATYALIGVIVETIRQHYRPLQTVR